MLYLVHGAGDSDDSWTSVGRANNILDNLIAAGKAKPMTVVMPNGHTPDRPNGGAANILQNTDFGDELKVVIPYIDANYRTVANANIRSRILLLRTGFQLVEVIPNHEIRPGVFRDCVRFEATL